VLNLEPEDLVALTVEAAAMAKVPLAGTAWIPGIADSRGSKSHASTPENFTQSRQPFGLDDEISRKGAKVIDVL
jgi:hypothetical protein